MTLPDSLTRFRLGLYMGDYAQPISLMRCLGPFSAMAREDERLELVFPRPLPQGQDVGWTWLCQCDAIFYSHPHSEFDLSVLWLAHSMGIPIWSEYVDDIFNVAPANPHYQLVKNKRALRELVVQAIEWSSALSTVSHYCAQAYPHPNRFAVIPEACLWPAWDLPRAKCVSWRGLSSHAGDVETVLPGLCAVARDFPDWTWALLGEPTEEFVAQLKDAAGEERVRQAPFFSTPFHALKAWGGCAPYLHLVPLADTPFNRAKSHLAWLEATAIGAAVIAPDHLPEWDQPGVIRYHESPLINGAANFADVLRCQLVAAEHDWLEPMRVHPNVELARQAIYPDRTLLHMNQGRWTILRSLASKVLGLESRSGIERAPALAPSTQDTGVKP